MTGKAPAATDQAGDTRQRLLLTALHLYAGEGLHAVSLRRISSAAGSKNSAATHYHFGDKLGVIRALIELIATELQKITIELGEQQPAQRSLRSEFRNTLLPLARLPLEVPWGADAVRFMSRLITEYSPEIAAEFNRVYEPFWLRVDGALAQLVPELPADIRRLRLMFMSTNVLHGVAEVASLAHTPLGDMSHFDNETLLDHLVDYLIGGLQATNHTRAYNTRATQQENPQ
jgi:AcrR family transcriptional regulator